jgi:pantoate--beta-alanine ligase
MIVAPTFASAREAVARQAARSGLGLVPTMGYLHDGHVALMNAARQECDTVVVSIFVNPLQFGPDEDLARYPRDLERDLTMCEAAGADVVFAPSVEEMYPEPVKVGIVLDELTEHLEGAHRPGHFEGVALVVTKLLAGLQPGRAYFGRKDAQQLTVVRRLAADLSFPVVIVPVSTIRHADGLALSSRNRFLSDAERSQARALSLGLFAAADAVEAGIRDGAELESIVRHEAAEAGRLQLEYAALADAATARPVASLVADSFLAVAARVGETRLIDNLAFSVEGSTVTVDRGVLLDGPSMLEDR